MRHPFRLGLLAAGASAVMYDSGLGFIDLELGVGWGAVGGWAARFFAAFKSRYRYKAMILIHVFILVITTAVVVVVVVVVLVLVLSVLALLLAAGVVVAAAVVVMVGAGVAVAVVVGSTTATTIRAANSVPSRLITHGIVDVA